MAHPIRALTVSLLALTAPGCLEREESLAIQPDGAILVSHVFTGPEAELAAGGDALPHGQPWTIDERRERSQDGKELLVREARARFEGVAALPTSFARADDPAALQFRTALAIEPLEDGSTRYTFERRYLPRAWAWHQRLERDVPAALRESVRERPLTELGAAVLEGLLELELRLRQELLEQAFQDMSAEGSWDQPTLARLILRARGALATRFRGTWGVEDAREWLRADQAGRERLEAEYREEVRGMVVEVGTWAMLVEGAPLETRQRLASRLGEEYRLAERRLRVTQDLQDDAFLLRVTFPGPVTLAGQGELQDDGRTVVFRFSGQDLNDAPLVLRATAVAPAGGPRTQEG